MKKFIIKFLHIDGSIREVEIEAFNEERARGRFSVNWGEDMKILNVSYPKGSFQLNGYKIKWSKTYDKWRVCKGTSVLEEFKDKDKAINFANDN